MNKLECKPIKIKFLPDGSVEIPVESGFSSEYIMELLQRLNIPEQQINMLKTMDTAEPLFGDIHCG